VLSTGPLRQGKFRKLSPDATTECTREEDIDISEFLLDDLKFINREEARLQKEILIDHKNSIHRIKAVEMKHGIDGKMISSRQAVKMLNGVDPYETMGKQGEITEEGLEQSLENLDYLLAQKGKEEGEKRQIYKKMAEKMDIRLDSTSPVRQVIAKQTKNVNPFAYEIKQKY
jgi:hypothetical protein